MLVDTILSLQLQGVVANNYNPSTWEVKAEQSHQVQGQAELHADQPAL